MRQCKKDRNEEQLQRMRHYFGDHCPHALSSRRALEAYWRKWILLDRLKKNEQKKKNRNIAEIQREYVGRHYKKNRVEACRSN